MSQDTVSFAISPNDAEKVRKIARRARKLYLQHKVDRDLIDIQMDLTATHANGCPLDFDRLLAADDFNLMHDVGGITRHLDRETGHLRDCFLPRFRLRVFKNPPPGQEHLKETPAQARKENAGAAGVVAR